MRKTAVFLCAVLLLLISACSTLPPEDGQEAETTPIVTITPIHPEQISTEEAMNYIKTTLPRLRDDSYSLKYEADRFVAEGGKAKKEYYLFSINRTMKNSEVISGYSAVNSYDGTIYIYYPEEERLVAWSEDELWGSGVKHTLETVKTYDWNGEFVTDDGSATLTMIQNGRYSFTFSIEIDTALGSFVLEDLEASIPSATATNEMNNAVYEDPDGDFSLHFTFFTEDSVRIVCAGAPFNPGNILPDGVYTKNI